MTFFECVKMAFMSMKTNKMRSFLTMLGIIIGISSVITITSIGSTIKKTVSSSILGTGLNIVEVYLDYRDYTAYSPKPTDNDKISDEMLNGLIEKYPDDFQLIKSTYLYELESVNDDNENIFTSVSGINSGYMSFNAKTILKGRNITHRDLSEQKNVAIVSEVFEKQYCGSESIIGKTISLNGMYNFKVTIIGVYKDRTTMKDYENGETVSSELFIPYSLALRMKGQSNIKANYALIQYSPDKDPDKMHRQIKDYFDNLYKNNENFMILTYNYLDDMKIITVTIDIIAVAFALIAAISLVVGGVGVMNIMLVSVVERTSEIGIRKALGAKTSDIKKQFITEAVIICSTGGIIGIILGLVESYLLGYIAKVVLNQVAADVADYIHITVNPSIAAIIISVVVAVLTGVIFGSSPAKRAAKMNPIDALRFE